MAPGEGLEPNMGRPTAVTRAVFFRLALALCGTLVTPSTKWKMNLHPVSERKNKRLSRLFRRKYQNAGKFFQWFVTAFFVLENKMFSLHPLPSHGGPADGVTDAFSE